jgi:flagellar biosynthesis/type III secretory pathway M-ring protein FliF/YscJ
MYGAATVGVKLQVPVERADEARIILSQNWSLPTDEKADFEDLV